MMTPEEIKAANALCEKATPGPWGNGPVREDPATPMTAEQFVEWMRENAAAGVADDFYSVVQSATGLHPAITGNGPTSAANAQFIAAARTLLPKALSSLTEAYQEIERLRKITDSPDPRMFWTASDLEARYQRILWGNDGDAGKTDADWFWLIGFLAGKALHNPDGDVAKKLHRITTIAAAASNWHAAVLGDDSMGPGTSLTESAT